MKKNNKKDILYPLQLYFHSEDKEQMDAYKVINSTRRKKTKFIVQLVTKFLRDNGIKDVNDVSFDYLRNLVEGKNNNFEDIKKFISHARPEEVNELKRLLGLENESNLQPNPRNNLKECQSEVIIQGSNSKQDMENEEHIEKEVQQFHKEKLSSDIKTGIKEEQYEDSEDMEESTYVDKTVVKGILSMFSDE